MDLELQFLLATNLDKLLSEMSKENTYTPFDFIEDWIHLQIGKNIEVSALKR